MLQRALDVVFPPRCAGCGDGAWPFCDRCRRALRRPVAAVVRSLRRSLERGHSAAAATARPTRSRWRGRRSRSRGRRDRRCTTSSTAGSEGSDGRSAAAMATCAPAGADVVTWVPLTRRRQGRARLRPSPGPRGRGRAGTRPSRAAPAPTSASRPDRRPNATPQRGVPPCVDRSSCATGIEVPAARAARRRRAHDGRDRGRLRRGAARRPGRLAGDAWSSPPARSCAPGDMPILDRALVRVCGCPGIIPGSRRQPRAKRPT